MLDNNELQVGESIAKALQDGAVKRTDLWIQSKLWNIFHEPKRVRGALLEVLQRLRLSHLDLFLIHWPVSFPFESSSNFYPKSPNGQFLVEKRDLCETWKALEDMVDEGLATNIGVCNFLPRELDQILKSARVCCYFVMVSCVDMFLRQVAPLVNQFEVHPYLPQDELLACCQLHGVQVQAYSPLGSPSLGRGPVLLQDTVVSAIASRRNMTPAQVLLKFALQRNTQPLVKSETPSRIRENWLAQELPSLPEEDIVELRAISSRYRYVSPLWRTWEA